MPLIKKSDLDAADVKSYRPMSNLSVLSKLLERIIAKQLIAYLKQNNMLPRLQSAYRSGHSTETAVLKVLSEFSLQLTLATYLRWPYWTYLQHSTPLVITYF
jgi:hypothetical protein